jgi:6-pyruvoyltetrahydropterin/6-carboxytetrahydropterin synthase
MFITRKAEFSASHRCAVPNFSDEQNRKIFGPEANPSGHGHNYVLEVTLEGDPDPLTGMLMDLKDLKDILETEVVNPMDHRFLNEEVAPFRQVVPTAPNVAREIWRRLVPRLQGPNYRLARIRLHEGPDFYVDISE